MQNDIGFKVVTLIAVIAVLTLLGSAGYYLYTAQQVGTKAPAPSTASGQSGQTVPPSAGNTTPGTTALVSSVDTTTVIGSELNGTSLEDFTGDFVELQQDSAGL